MSVWITNGLFSSFISARFWPVLLRHERDIPLKFCLQYSPTSPFHLHLIDSPRTLTSLDSSSLEYTLVIGSAFFLLLLFVLFVSFFDGGGFRPRPLDPLRPTPLVSSSAANANRSVYCFWKEQEIEHDESIQGNRIRATTDTHFCTVAAVRKRLLQSTLHCILNVQTGTSAVTMSTTSSEMFQMAEQLKLKETKDVIFVEVSLPCFNSDETAIHTWSAVGELFCAELFFSCLFRLFGELFWYFDVRRLAIISESFSSKSWHQNLWMNGQLDLTSHFDMHIILTHRRADVTNGSPRDLASLLNNNRINSVVGFSLCNNSNMYVKASAWFDDSNSGRIPWKVESSRRDY